MEAPQGTDWRWSEGQGRWTSLPSPPMAGHGSIIDERGSFLEPLQSFNAPDDALLSLWALEGSPPPASLSRKQPERVETIRKLLEQQSKL